MPARRPVGTVTTTQLVDAARTGEQEAWNQLVDRYARLVWAVTRDFRMADSDASDVAQTTWLRLLEHIDRIDPERMSAWLATTARRECLRVLAMRKRVMLAYDGEALEGIVDEAPAVDEPLLADERARDVRRALQALPDRWQRLLDLAMADPPASYAEISAKLDMPIGSIGPLRARSLARLRTMLER